MTQRRPNLVAIKAQVTKAHTLGPFADKAQVCRAILRIWHTEHFNPDSNWKHGVGNKSGSTPPDPDQQNPSSAMARYFKGITPQNVEGWQMIAEKVFRCHVDEFLEPHPVASVELPHAQTIFLPNPSGQIALQHLANLEVATPIPRDGSNRAIVDNERPQDLSLNCRLIFNTMRNEPIVDEEGVEVGLADVELSNALIVVELSSEVFSLIDAKGLQGEITLGELLLRYIGQDRSTLLFEVSRSNRAQTLAGISQVVEAMLRIKGTFSTDDSIGVGFDQNAIVPVHFRFFHETDESKSPAGPMRRAIMAEVFRRGIQGPFTTESTGEIRLAAVRRFMEGLDDEYTTN